MDQITFQENVNDRIQKSLAVLTAKNDGYNPDADKLAGFKRAAQLQNMTARRALGGMMTKHTLSVYDIIESDTVASEELVDEKLGDLINYCLLLSAVLEEERAAESEKKYVEPLAEWEKELYKKTPAGWYELPDTLPVPPGCKRIMEAATGSEAAALDRLGYVYQSHSTPQDKVFTPTGYGESDVRPLLTKGYYEKDGDRKFVDLYKVADTLIKEGWVYSDDQTSVAPSAVRGYGPDQTGVSGPDGYGVSVTPTAPKFSPRIGEYEKGHEYVSVLSVSEAAQKIAEGWSFVGELPKDIPGTTEIPAEGEMQHPRLYVNQVGNKIKARTRSEVINLVQAGYRFYMELITPNLAYDGA